METIVKLSVGLHASAKDGMCVMEAVSFVAGEPFGDHPKCASRVIAAYMRSLNDGLMRDHLDELIAYIPRLAASAGSKEREIRLAFLVADAAVRRFAPVALEAAGLLGEAERLRNLPSITASAARYDAASVARYAASVARDAASVAEVGSARYDAASAAFLSADYAADAASVAFVSGVGAARYAAYAAEVGSAVRAMALAVLDEMLNMQ